jgi:hypothetical protein
MRMGQRAAAGHEPGQGDRAAREADFRRQRHRRPARLLHVHGEDRGKLVALHVEGFEAYAQAEFARVQPAPRGRVFRQPAGRQRLQPCHLLQMLQQAARARAGHVVARPHRPFHRQHDQPLHPGAQRGMGGQVAVHLAGHPPVQAVHQRAPGRALARRHRLGRCAQRHLQPAQQQQYEQQQEQRLAPTPRAAPVLFNRAPHGAGRSGV